MPRLCESVVADVGVYAPQEDSWLLIETMRRTTPVHGRRVLDLCTGSGVLAVAAAQLGAVRVAAYDICTRAVRCARNNASAAGVEVDVQQGSLSDALADGPFDVVVSNPPYVPVNTEASGSLSLPVGPALAWDAGADGRLVLDPLCAAAPKLLAERGRILIVQSEFAGVERSLDLLRSGGLDAEVVLWQWIPFGPVLTSRARWLERTGLVDTGRRTERLAVIRADKR
ncbi:MAG: release factor glutamine methyltransferase [Mycobacterium sp.]|jgi:release factor glutamine methyltransferase|nr:release factor glutamine methyltransferase [Mycobacterium sp.]